MKKKIYGILLIMAVTAIFLLTLQSPQGTVRLSEGVRLWLWQFGIEMTFHGIRSNAHLPLYFVFGLILSLYGRESGWRWRMILIAGAAVGLADEVLKIFLPTREFDLIDLIKDWIGVGTAACVIWLIQKVKARHQAEKGKRHEEISKNT